VKKRKIFLIVIAGVIGLSLADYWLLPHQKPQPDRPLRFWVGCFSPDGKTILTTGGTQDDRQPPDSCEILLWDAATGKRRELLHQAATVRSVAWSHNGKFVVLGDWGGTTELVNPATGKVLGFLTAHGDVVNSVAVSPDDNVIATACVDGTLTICEAAGKELNTFVLGNDRVMSVAIAPNGNSLAAGAASGYAYIYLLPGHGEPVRLSAYPTPVMGREHRVETVAYSPDGHSLVTGCQNTLRVWDPSNGQMIREWNVSPGKINNATFSPDGETLATIDAFGTLILWDPATGKQKNSTMAHPCSSFSISFTADGRRIATVGRDDYTLNIWDAQSLARLASFHRKVNQ
jgi:WD40 repeat protein